jgi:hypothetical protein
MGFFAVLIKKNLIFSLLRNPVSNLGCDHNNKSSILTLPLGPSMFFNLAGT